MIKRLYKIKCINSPFEMAFQKEWEWITFLGCIIVIKGRRQCKYLLFIDHIRINFRH